MFDIFTANHFVEWRADYHHSSLSHSLLVHDPYPTSIERRRYIRAYLGVDGGYDGTDDKLPEHEDPRVERLEQEIELWQPSSHAMWAVWGVVQSKEDLMNKIKKWKKACEDRLKDGVENGMGGLDLNGNSSTSEEEKVIEATVEEEEVEHAAEFDYLAYTMTRIELFREELEDLGVY